MNRPALVLVHGSYLNGGQWAPYRELFPGVDLAIPDLPAHGTRRGEDFTWAGALAAIDDAVGSLGGRAVVAGHSLGGYLVLDYAASRPARVAGLGVLGATAVPVGPGARAYRALGHLDERLGERRVSRLVDRSVRTLIGPDMADNIVDGGGYGVDGIPAAWDAVTERGRPETLAEVTVPTLLMAGALDQLGVNLRTFARSARRTPWLNALRLAGAPHAFPLSHVAETSAALRELVEVSYAA